MRLRSLYVPLLAAALLVPTGATAAGAATGSTSSTQAVSASGATGSTAGSAGPRYKSAATQRAKRSARAARAVAPQPLVVAPPPVTAPAPSYADRVLVLTNAERTSRGLRPLQLSPCADRYADAWAGRLAAVGTLSHQSLRTILSACAARRVGENVAGGPVTADRMVAMWMASSGHRANLLNPAYTHVGIGAVPTAGGRVFGVQVFLAL